MPDSQLFDSDYVSANRHGELTRDQRQAYVSVSTGGRGGWLSVALAGVILFAAVALFGTQLSALQGAAQIIAYGVVLVALVLAAAFVNFLYAIPARHRAASAHVERRNGEVTFQYGNYFPVADGQRLRSIFYDENNLLPGSYTFYTIKGTNWIVSSEKQADAELGSAPSFELDPRLIQRLPESMRDKAAQLLQMQAEATKDQNRFDLNELRAALAAAFGFDQSALEMNRQGKLAPSQRARFRRAGSSYFRWAAIFAALGVGAVILVVTKEQPVDLGGVAAIILFFGGISVYMFYRWSRESADSRRGIVEMTEGSVHKYTRDVSGSSSNTTFYYYGINDLSFEVPPGAYNALIEHVRYRIYYTPVSNQITSIEPVE